jgi:hypothetical protein
MPGIVGLITKMPKERAEAELSRMVRAQRHNPSFVTGTWSDEDIGAYVGWVVRKNSFADVMPLTNESGNISLVFSGEEYPEPGTASRLKERGTMLNPVDRHTLYISPKRTLRFLLV